MGVLALAFHVHSGECNSSLNGGFSNSYSFFIHNNIHYYSHTTCHWVFYGSLRLRACMPWMFGYGVSAGWTKLSSGRAFFSSLRRQTDVQTLRTRAQSTRYKHAWYQLVPQGKPSPFRSGTYRGSTFLKAPAVLWAPRRLPKSFTCLVNYAPFRFIS